LYLLSGAGVGAGDEVTVRELCQEDRGEYVVREEGAGAMSDEMVRNRAREVIVSGIQSISDHDLLDSSALTTAIIAALDAAGLQLRDSDQTAEEVAAHILAQDDEIRELEAKLDLCVHLENIQSDQLAVVMPQLEAAGTALATFRAFVRAMEALASDGTGPAMKAFDRARAAVEPHMRDE
jgi:ABC-type transporter Mla subunit MlaD